LQKGEQGRGDEGPEGDELQLIRRHVAGLAQDVGEEYRRK
jgi:hypothetical protein